MVELISSNGAVTSVQDITSEREAIEKRLLKDGFILFRNGGLRDVRDFEDFVSSLCDGLYADYGDLPRVEGVDRIYKSTPYPAEEMILFHNESSHLVAWPRKQWFYCISPATSGGATPIVDCRKVYLSLPESIRDDFECKGLTYTRTFIPQLDVRWQDFFGTNLPGEVEEICATSGIHAVWLAGGVLQIRTECPGVITHPITQEKSFFNQVQLHHPTCLDQEVVAGIHELFGKDVSPRDVRFSTGEPISAECMRVIGEIYEHNAIRFEWEKGDVLMLDNMLTAHARDPYHGERLIAVAMAEMVKRDDLFSNK